MGLELEITVNGRKHRVDTDRRRTLLDFLREDLGLTGAKYGCGEGQCRSCTVLVDGKPAASCQVRLSRIPNREVQTIEGLAADGKLHPVQQAFLDAGALQCGFCVSGMILATVGLLRENPNPGDGEIVEALNGNICRCNGYVALLDAVRRAAGRGKEVKTR